MLGVLYVPGFHDSLVPGWNLIVPLVILVGSLIVLAVVAGLIGMLFGRLTSHGLVRRPEGLNSVA